MDFYLTLQNKIFISIISIVVILSAVTTSISSYSLKKILTKQHKNTILEKEKRIKFYLENTLSKYYDNKDNKNTTELIYEKIVELYDIENVDISVFALNGKHITSTTDTQNNINDDMLRKIQRNKSTLQIHKTVDDTDVTYSYSYIYNERNEPIVILKFPYVESNNSLEQNLNIFLKTMTILTLLMILLATITTYYISNNLTKSLSEIIVSIQENIASNDSRVFYQIDNELLPIVKAYNQSLDKIEDAQKIIKKNQRDLAWRDLARRLAHDIKNPLTPMRLMAQDFRYNFKTVDDYQKNRLVKFTDAIITQIDMIVSTISSFSSNIQKNKDVIIDINEYIESTIHIFNSKDVSFYPSDDNLQILIDKNLFIRIITNIVTNSIQAIPKTKKPKITIYTKKFGFNEVLISISDNGIGIPESMREKIFETDFTTKSSGSGLGLAIVKKIITTYKGKITVNSKEGKYTTFTIRLPLATKS